MDDRHINGPKDLARLSWMLMRKGAARVLHGLRETAFGLIDLGYGILLPLLIVGTLYASVVRHFLTGNPALEGVAEIIVGILIAPLPIVAFAILVGSPLWIAAKITKWWRSRSRKMDTYHGPTP